MANSKQEVSQMEWDYLETLEYSLYISPEEVTRVFEKGSKRKTMSAP
jgi:hypothetical protein